MTKDEKISNFERVLSWLPEAFKSWATSNPFLSSTLNEVLNERDTRLSGTPCTSRLKTAVTALLQKLQDRRDKSAALILAASREAEETAFTLASRMSEGTGLRIAATTGVRDGAGLTAIFAAAPDLVVTNPKVLEKVFDKGFAAPEAFRTILVDGAEWHDVMGDTDLIASLIERFPAAHQLIVTGPVVVETTEDPYNAMLHAPAYCRAPDEAAREAAPKERVVLVPEEKMSETLAREAEKTPVLFLVSTPTESTRVTGLLKEAGIAAKRVSGKPLVVHMHATEYDRSGENVNTQVYAIERAGMHAADRVIAVSNLTRNIVINRYGVPAEKIVTVHNAVRFAQNSGKVPERGVTDKVVTFLGRITYQKGPDYFVEAAAKVLKRIPDVRFVMAGSGDMMNHVIRRVARLGIADRFHFTGFLRGEDVHKMFQLSDVYVMPSVSEPFGISPLEAMRSNVPVIISKQSGVAEVLDYAVKVDYWDVDALADAIYGLIKYPALSGMFASKGLEEVTNLKWNDAAAKIKSVYEAVIEENKKQLK